ncbi:MAG: CapA family protein, partial [Actinobacteria bacterium]
SDVAPRLMAADLTVGNLESPLSSRGAKVPNKSYTFQGTPLGADALASAGFDVVSVANNHVLDFGPVALSDTLANLDAKQIAYAGAGRTRTDAWRAATVDAAGNSVACLAFSDIVPPGFAADADSPGIADSRKTMDEVAAAVKAAAASHDFVLVSMHWGDEYQYDANDEQVRDAHRLVNAGADMVLAHHPHVIQGIERYKGALIAYSLGDFVFDHDLRSTGESFILEAELGPAGVGEATCTPIYCSDTNGRPEYIHGKEAAVVTKRVRTLSKRLGTKVTVVGDVARVER